MLQLKKIVCITTWGVNHLFQHDMMLTLWTAIRYLQLTQNLTQYHFDLIQGPAIDMRRYNIIQSVPEEAASPFFSVCGH